MSISDRVNDFEHWLQWYFFAVAEVVEWLEEVVVMGVCLVGVGVCEGVCAGVVAPEPGPVKKRLLPLPLPPSE